LPGERLTGDRLVYGYVWAELYLNDKGGTLKNVGLFGVNHIRLEFSWQEV
jgi:hypothetical protein